MKTITAEEIEILRGATLISAPAISQLFAFIDQLTARNAELVSRYDSAVGVGGGNGDLFVYGKYDAVKKVQSLILAHAALLSRAEAAEAEIKRRDALSPVAYRWRWSDDAPVVWRYTEEPRKTNGGVTAESLFTAAPAPVVLPEIEPTIQAIRKVIPTANPDEYACCVGADMWNACRAAMLKGGAE